MKDIETITLDGAMYSKPWKKHELDEVVRVEMDYHSLMWCCYIIQLINKTVADRLEYELIYGVDRKPANTLATEEAILILQLERIKREILSNEGRDAYYLAALDKAILALKMVDEKTQLSEEEATN